jgi:hypothetical protein
MTETFGFTMGLVAPEDMTGANGSNQLLVVFRNSRETAP